MSLLVLAFPTPRVIAADKTSITMWFFSGIMDVQAWAKAYEAKFNAENPDIELHLDIVDTKTWQETILVASVAGTGPDISYMSSNLIPGQIERGLTLPLNRYLDKYADYKDFVPDLFQAVSDGNGRIHALPFAMWSIFDLYNMNVLSESGVQFPQDWSSQIVAARKMTVVNSDGTVARYGYAIPQTSLWAILNLEMAMEQLGKGMLYMGGTKTELNNQRGIIAAEYLRDLWSVGMPDGSTTASSNANSVSGKVAINGYASYNLMDIAVNDTAALEPRRHVGPAPGEDVVRFNCATLYILSTSKHPDQAWRVLSDFLSPANSENYLKAQVSYLPVRKSLFSRMSRIVTHPIAAKMTNITYSPIYTYGVVHAYWTDIRTVGGDVILPALQRKTAIQSALVTAESTMNAILADKMGVK